MGCEERVTQAFNVGWGSRLLSHIDQTELNFISSAQVSKEFDAVVSGILVMLLTVCVVQSKF